MDITHNFVSICLRKIRKWGKIYLPPSDINPSPFVSHAALVLGELEGLRLDQISTAALKDCNTKIEKLQLSSDDVPADQPSARAHHHGIVAFMYSRLESMAEAFQLREVDRITREKQVSRYFVGSVREIPQVSNRPRWRGRQSAVREEEAGLKTIPEDKKNALLREEQILIASYETDIDVIREAQGRLEELAGLMNVFSTNVQEQAELADAIHFEAVESTQLMEAADDHLARAVQRSSSYRWVLVCFYLLACLLLLLFDWIKF